VNDPTFAVAAFRVKIEVTVRVPIEANLKFVEQ